MPELQYLLLKSATAPTWIYRGGFSVQHIEFVFTAANLKDEHIVAFREFTGLRRLTLRVRMAFTSEDIERHLMRMLDSLRLEEFTLDARDMCPTREFIHFLANQSFAKVTTHFNRF